MEKYEMGIFSVLFLLVSGTLIGITGHIVYKDWNNKVEIQGLYFNNWQDESSVKDKAYSMDSSGQWVCINVNKDMKYEDIVTTCQHEAGHELVAKKCGDNPKLCLDIEEELK